MAQTATRNTADKPKRAPQGPRPLYAVLDLSTLKVDEETGQITGKPEVMHVTRKSEEVMERIEGAPAHVIYIRGVVK